MEASASKVTSISNLVRRYGCVCFAAAALALPFAACAAGGSASSDASNASAAPEHAHSSLKPSPEFARLPQYAGTLGKRPIVMRLGGKTDDPDDKTGVHGEYQFTDTGEVVLIAGDRTGTTLEAEESDDGSRITGNWVGTFADDGSITGERMEIDDSNPQAFDLKPLGAGASAPAVAHPVAKGGRAVNGVGNLVTGE
ncbi:hypothetical protein [Paraburkholderia sacchari]|uniref:hypothetical protein n=1 Tax=Paraburkholderia sacchari TaxID=159450 RepID=UPI003CC82B7B